MSCCHLRVSGSRALFEDADHMPEHGIKEEKKVEYVELIYDLIFVYLIGRNNSLLHQIEDGFVPGSVFLAYILCTLAVIQIWNFSTFYINRYGRNGAREYVFLFLNMYLMYYMAEGTNAHWQSSVYTYSTAWALILVNTAVQYLLELRHHCESETEAKQIKRTAAIILGEAALIGVHMLVYSVTGISAAGVPIAFGIIATMLSGQVNRAVSVDFAHLSERAMLYVVFTFGEMIIAVSSYFSGFRSFTSVYFSAMAFLVVIGLLLSYGMLYNHVIDRERRTSGTGYMMLHVFIILALNNISVALEFMPEEAIAVKPKNAFLAGSIVLYYVFMFLTELYGKRRQRFARSFKLLLLSLGGLFLLLIGLLRENGYITIAITVVFVYGITVIMHFYGKRTEPAEGE